MKKKDLKNKIIPLICYDNINNKFLIENSP